MNIALNSLQKKSFASMLWMSMSVGGQGVLTLVVFAILARILTPELFGIIAAGQSFIMISLIVSQFGFGYILIQEKTISQDYINTSATLSILFGCLCALLIFCFSNQIATFYNMPELSQYLEFMCLVIPFQGYASIKESLLKREMDFKMLAIIQITSYLIAYGLIGIILAKNGFKAWSLATAFTSQYFLMALLLFLFSRTKIRFGFNLELIYRIVKNGENYTIAEILFGIVANGEKIIIGKLLGKSELGYYSRAYQIMIIPSAFFGKVIDQVLFSGIAKLQTEVELLKKIYLRGISLAFSSITPFSIIIIVMAPEIIDILLGEKWGDAVIPLRLLAGAIIFRVGYNLSDSFAKGIGLYKERILATSVFASTIIGFVILGSCLNGLTGACIGFGIAIVISFFIMLMILKKALRFSIHEYCSKLIYPMITLIHVGMASWIYLIKFSENQINPMLKVIVFAGVILVQLGLQYLIIPNKDIQWLIKNVTDFRTDQGTN